MSERERKMEELIREFAVHGSWRCYSDYYPGECRCGLDESLEEIGMPTPDFPNPSWPEGRVEKPK